MEGLHTTPLYSVFSKRVTLLGIDRNIAICTFIVTAAVLMILISKMLLLHSAMVLALAITWLIFITRVTAADNDIVLIFLRHIKYKKYYLARSTSYSE